jgi:hypothetical protein
MTAKCRICNSILLLVDIIGDERSKSIALGQAMLEHFQTGHPKFIKQLVVESRLFNGFIIMNRFIIDDTKVEDEKENMRDLLADKIMEDAPEMDDIEDDDQIEDDEETRNDEELDHIGDDSPIDPNFTKDIKTIERDKEVIDVKPIIIK